MPLSKNKGFVHNRTKPKLFKPPITADKTKPLTDIICVSYNGEIPEGLNSLALGPLLKSDRTFKP